MSSTEVLYQVSQRIATVTLNRPERLNAYTAALGDALRAAMRRASDDPDVRVICSPARAAASVPGPTWTA